MPPGIWHDMLNRMFNACGQRPQPARFPIFLLLIVMGAMLACKSWGKFWQKYDYTPGQITALYTNASLWNDYITADGTALTVRGVSANAPSGISSRLNATGVACNAGATGGYGVCIHAGLMRSVTVGDKDDCTGFSVSDSLGVFTWVCDASVKPVRLISVGLNDGKYLSDLIDFDTVTWRTNAVTVVADGVSYTSPLSRWWNNPVQNLPAASYGVASTIYLVQSNPNYAVQIFNNADKTALLIKRGVKVTPNIAVTIVNNNAKNFTWYEGQLDYTGLSNSNSGFMTGFGSFVVMQNFAIQNGSTSTSTGAFEIGAKNSFFRNIRFANAVTPTGGYISVRLGATADANTILGLNTSNDEFPLILSGAVNNVLLNYTSHSNGNTGNVNIDFQSASNDNAILNFISANSFVGGTIGPIRISSGANNTLMNIAVANSTDRGVVNAGGTSSQIINVAVYCSAGANCSTGGAMQSSGLGSYFGGVMNFPVNTCIGGTNFGLNNICSTLQNASDYNLVGTSMTAINSFVGKVVVDDPANASDNASGLATYLISMDALNFSNAFRSYGIDNGAAWPNASHQGRCLSANCQIWDWSLKATDTQYRNLLSVPTGNDVAAHKWSAGGPANCTQPGAVWNATNTCNYAPFPGSAGVCNSTVWATGSPSMATAACLTTFLRNAYEIIGDGIGNENGLCESNEACIYTPNIASYQGHGNLTCIRGPAEYGCASTFVSGTVSGVVLYQYATNGY
jgi:hypothetical protein